MPSTGPAHPARWQRRARPLLGTLVEIGVGRDTAGDRPLHAAPDTPPPDPARSGFEAIEAVQGCLSRFDPDSDIARFNALGSRAFLTVRPVTVEALRAASELQRLTGGLFDISLGSAPGGWTLDDNRLVKHDARARLDLGGIGKGLAVDRAVQALIDDGVCSGWVNAGGDLRVFGHAELPIQLRDERAGGVRPFALLHNGAFATSRFGGSARATLAGGAATAAHVSVAAPRCLWADALTKIVAASGDPRHPLLARYDAAAWQH